MGRGAAEVGTAIAARGQNDGVRAEAVQRAFRHVERHHATAFAVFHDEVDGEVFDEELRLVLQGLLVQRVQHGVASAVRRGASALGNALAVVRGHATEGALVDLALLGTAERHTVVLQFNDRGRSFLAHILDGVLVAQPVRPFDGVVEVEAPVVFAHVAKRRRDTALRRHRVAAGGEHLGDIRDRQPGLCQAEGGPQTGTAGTNHHYVVGVVFKLVSGRHLRAHAAPPRLRRTTASTMATPSTAWMKFSNSVATNFAPLP